MNATKQPHTNSLISFGPGPHDDAILYNTVVAVLVGMVASCSTNVNYMPVYGVHDIEHKANRTSVHASLNCILKSLTSLVS